MKPAPFDHITAHTVTEAINHLANVEQDVKILAGGQSLIPVLNMRMAHPEILVDITRIEELQRVEVTPLGELRIGAGVRQSDAMHHPDIRRGWPVVVQALGLIGHPQIRNSGTVCGSLAHSDSSAELPAIAVLLDAVVEVTSTAGDREIPATDFFLGTFTTDLAPDELVVAVRFPAMPAGVGCDITEFAQRRGDFATVGVATLVAGDEGVIHSARAVFFGVGSTPVRVRAIEDLLEGSTPTADLTDRVLAALSGALDPPTDVHASSTFRLEIATHILTRSIKAAWEDRR